MKPIAYFVSLLPVILLSACASDPEPRSDFGASVNNMIERQIYDPQAAANPPLDPPSSTDGEHALRALKRYREAGIPGAETPDPSVQVEE